MAVLALGACGLDEDGDPALGEVTSAATVASFITTSCSTASVLGLSNQIATEIGCMNANSLVRFAPTNGITFSSSAVIPFLEANARRDLLAVGNLQLNSAFRTVAAQFLIVEWFNRGRCGITAAAAPGRSNHESGRAVDVGNFSARITAMANRGWAHDVPGDPVHFDHLSSPDIRGRDTLAFQRLWNRNHAGDRIAEDGIYGPQTEARIRQSPSTGFPVGPQCASARAAAEIVAIDGPDRLAPGARAHYRIAIQNTTDAAWPATTRIVVAGGTASELYDAATWVSAAEVGTLDAPVAAGTFGVIELDVVAPQMAAPTPIATDLVLTDGGAELGTVSLAVTVTPDGDEDISIDADDQFDDVEVSGGCNAGGGAGWLAFAPALLALRRRRRVDR